MNYYIGIKPFAIVLLLTTLIMGCDKDGVNYFKLTVVNPTLENATVIIDDFTGYVAPTDDKKFNIKVDGYNGKKYDVRTVLNTDGALKEIDLIEDFEFKNGYSYQYTIGSPSITEVSTDGSDSDLVGQWMLSSGCVNVDGNSNYYRFYSDGTGYFFTADCMSECEDYGIFFYFNYGYSSDSLTLINTDVSEYCGIFLDTPESETVGYSIIDDLLYVGTNTYIRQ